MAGYIFALNNEDSLEDCIKNGVYSTNLSKPTNEIWKMHHEGTFADYLSMNEGDNIYFFIKRKIYGIGKLVNIKSDCKFLNYVQADFPTVQNYEDIKHSMILNYNEDSINNRCLCTFEPCPNFFESGVDIDDVLVSNPEKFNVIRAFWKLSFIKIDDEENKALRDIILKRNEEFIYNKEGIYDFNNILHNEIKKKTNKKYIMNSNNILKSCSNGTYIRHEMAIECGLLDVLNNKRDTVFGNWDYISHQVIASPFKPVDYMDKMDVFGYKYIRGFDTISKYLLVEIKKDEATKEAVDQIMKYVEWINKKYSHGDYSMICAFIVAYDFSKDVIEYRDEICIRNYIKGSRPTITDTWRNVKLIKYRFINDNLDFQEVT